MKSCLHYISHLGFLLSMSNLQSCSSIPATESSQRNLIVSRPNRLDQNPSNAAEQESVLKRLASESSQVIILEDLSHQLPGLTKTQLLQIAVQNYDLVIISQDLDLDQTVYIDRPVQIRGINPEIVVNLISNRSYFELRSGNVHFKSFSIHSLTSNQNCVFKLSRPDTSQILLNLSFKKIHTDGLSCFMENEDSIENTEDRYIKDLEISDVHSTNHRGRFTRLQHVQGFFYSQNIEIEMAEDVASPIFYLEDNGGALFKNISIKGATERSRELTNNHGFLIINSTSVWMNRITVRNLSGNTIDLRSSDYCYLRDISSLNNNGMDLKVIDSTGLRLAAMSGNRNIELNRVTDSSLIGNSLNVIQNNTQNILLTNFIPPDLAQTLQNGDQAFSANFEVFLHIDLIDQLDSSFVNLASYGVSCDSQTDDTLSFERAIEDTSNSNFYFFGGNGTCILSRLLEIRHPIKLFFLSPTLIRFESNPQIMISIQSSNVHIGGLRPYHAESSPNSVLFKIQNDQPISNISLENITALGEKYGHGIVKSSNTALAENIQLKDISFPAPLNTAIDMNNVILLQVSGLKSGHASSDRQTISNNYFHFSNIQQLFCDDCHVFGHGASVANREAKAFSIENSTNVRLNRTKAEIVNGQGFYFVGNISTSILDSGSGRSMFEAVEIRNSSNIHFVNFYQMGRVGMDSNNQFDVPRARYARFFDSDQISFDNSLFLRNFISFLNSNSTNIHFNNVVYNLNEF